MFGLILAALYVAFKSLLGSAPLPHSLLAAAGFLQVWYIVWLSVSGLFLFVVTLLLVFGGGASVASVASSGLGKAFGAIGGMAVGGGVSLLIWGAFLIRAALLVGGLRLVLASAPQALAADGSFSGFDTTRLLIGGVLVLVGALMGRSSSSSKKD